MFQPLATKYRPQRFAETVGQATARAILQASVSSRKVPPAFIFSGHKGTGKTSFARIYGAALNCQEGEAGDACAKCPSCRAVQSGASLSVLEIDAANNGGVDEVRRLRDLCTSAPDQSWRVIVLDEAHSLSPQAFNSLLKILEEPPTDTVFLLVTTDPQKIPPTVQSRAMRLDFHRISTPDLFTRLSQVRDSESLPVGDALLAEIARISDGGLREALVTLDQAQLVGLGTVTEFREFFGFTDLSVPLLRAAIAGDFRSTSSLVQEFFSSSGDFADLVRDLSSLVADLLVVLANGTPQGVSDARLQELAELSRSVTPGSLMSVARTLWDADSKILVSRVDPVSLAQLSFALLVKDLSGSLVS